MRNHVLRLLLILVIFIGVAHTASAAHYIKVEGTTYPIRWGQNEQNDTVTPYAAVGNPVCIRRGSKITLSIADSANELVSWQLISASLVSKTDNTTYFTYTDPNSSMRPISDKVEIGSVPDKIEYAELRVTYIAARRTVVAPPGGVASTSYKTLKRTHQTTQKLNYGTVSLKYGASSAYGRRQYPSATIVSDVFVVLEAPKAPMSPAWVRVLHNSCAWAAGETTKDGAAKKLTERFYQEGHYYTLGNIHTSLDGKTLYLKDFFDDPSFPHGQCDDFVDFLVYLVHSAGAMEMNVQRSNIDTGYGQFRTKIVKAAGEPGQHSNVWHYHQFSVSDSNVWDACIGVPTSGGYIPPTNKDRYPDYFSLLIDYYLQGYGWDPQMASSVSVTTQPKPENP